MRRFQTIPFSRSRNRITARDDEKMASRDPELELAVHTYLNQVKTRHSPEVFDRLIEIMRDVVEGGG